MGLDQPPGVRVANGGVDEVEALLDDPGADVAAAAVGGQDLEDAVEDAGREGAEEPLAELLVLGHDVAGAAVALEDAREDVHGPLLLLPPDQLGTLGDVHGSVLGGNGGGEGPVKG